MKRWEKESREFLEQLGGSENPLDRKPSARPSGDVDRDEIALREALYRRTVSGRGRPARDSAAAETGRPELTVYNFKCTKDTLEKLRRVSLVETRLMREIFDEAIEDFLVKHADSLRK